MLLLPNRGGEITIRRNLLDQWVVQATFREAQATLDRLDRKIACDTLQHAFQYAESLLPRRLLPMLRRESAWHEKPATDRQRDLLRRLLRGSQPIPENLGRGEASRIITSLLAARK